MDFTHWILLLELLEVYSYFWLKKNWKGDVIDDRAFRLQSWAVAVLDR